LPKLAGRVIATEEDFGCGGCPVERAAQFAGDGRYGVGTEVSALGEAVVALHPGPEAAVGKAVMGFGVVKTLGQLTLGDVGDEADMGSGGLQVLLLIEGGEIAAVPGAAEQRRELCLATLQRIEDGGELLREREETAVGGRLLIAHRVDKATGGEAGAGDARGEPRVVDFREEAGDLPPTGSLAALAGIAYQHDEEVEAVAGGIDHAVGSAADEVAICGQELEKDGGRVGFGVRSDGTDGEPCQSIKGGFA
jgi:hypothetical protein